MQEPALGTCDNAGDALERMEVVMVMMWRRKNALKNFCSRSEIKLVSFFQSIVKG